MDRNDAVDTIFFERELEQVKTRSYDVLKAPLAATRMIPVDSTTSPGARTVTYDQYDSVGVAKIIANYADDMPLANVSGKQITSTLKSIGFGYEYSIDDVRAAQFAGKPIESRKATAAVRAHMVKMNALAFFGDADYGIQGWLTNTNIPAAPVSSGTALTTEWSTKTPDEILADLNSAVSYAISLTNGVAMPNTIGLPIDQHQLISTTRDSVASDTTIKEFFLRANPGFTFEAAAEFKGAFAGGTDGFVVYERSSDKLWQEVPQMVETFPAQSVNLAYKVPMHSKHGGTIVPYPLEQRFRYGI